MFTPHPTEEKNENGDLFSPFCKGLAPDRCKKMHASNSHAQFLIFTQMSSLRPLLFSRCNQHMAESIEKSASCLMIMDVTVVPKFAIA